MMCAHPTSAAPGHCIAAVSAACQHAAHHVGTPCQWHDRFAACMLRRAPWRLRAHCLAARPQRQPLQTARRCQAPAGSCRMSLSTVQVSCRLSSSRGWHERYRWSVAHFSSLPACCHCWTHNPFHCCLNVLLSGRESGNGEQVAAFDLDDGEWAAFSDGIARLAAEQVISLLFGMAAVARTTAVPAGSCSGSCSDSCNCSPEELLVMSHPCLAVVWQQLPRTVCCKTCWTIRGNAAHWLANTPSYSSYTQHNAF
jgi:hypothetical protein